MELALNEAKKAYEIEEIPVGAIIVKDRKIFLWLLRRVLLEETIHMSIEKL